MFFSLFSYAQTGFTVVKNKNEVLKKIKETSNNTKSVQSHFVQYKHLEILENDIESKGIFLFSKPQKVRWEYTKPYPYLIIMTDKQMLIKESAKVQKYDIQSNPVFKEINDLMLGLLSGNIAEDKDFRLEFKESKTELLAILIPQNQELKQMLSQAELYFDKNDYGVSTIIMREQEGDYTRIVFKNRKYNVSIPNSRFMLH